jgi:hypothetical protein
MASETPEGRLSKRIRVAISREYPGAFVEKIAGGPYQSVGLPDLLVVIEGRAFGLEVKRQRPGETEQHARGRATPTQQVRIVKLRAAGAVADVVLTPQEALQAIAGTRTFYLP